MSFRRFVHENSGRIPVLSLLRNIDPSQIGTGNPIAGVTVTRASVRTCRTAADSSTVTSVAVNSPALEPEGLSIEGVRTNLGLRSSELDNAAWGRLGSILNPSIVANTIVAPDATTSAEVLTNQQNVTTGAGSYSIIRPTAGVGVTSGSKYTFSIWLKLGTVSVSPRLYINDGVTPGAGFVQTTITSAWQRVSVTFQVASVSALHTVGYFDQVANVSGQTYHMWGAQLELGAYARSYVPTTSATAAYQADIVTMSPSALPIARGSVELDFTPLWSTNASGATLIETRTASAPQTGIILSVTGDALSIQVGDDAAHAATSSALTWVAMTTYRIRATWGSGSLAIYRDGTLVASSTGSAMPNTHQTLRLGSNLSGLLPADGLFRRLTFYK